jgi:APA family basic amino acid/polyamine antiporter
MLELKREINLLGLTMIAVGACIGSGIFITPANSIDLVQHQGWVMIIWAIGGGITLLGALTFAELGSRFPDAGGVYVYIKEAFGELPAFLYGWAILLIVNTGAMAALGMALVDFLGFFAPIEGNMRTLLVIGIIVLLTVVNVFGVQISQVFASIFTGLKLLSILFIVLVIFLVGGSEPSPDLLLNPLTNTPKDLVKSGLLVFVGVFWSFGGWYHATYLAAETVNPKVTVPRALILSTFIVTLSYLLIILAYVLVVPMSEMAGSTRIAGDALAKVFEWGGKLVSLFIIVSIFGTMGIYTMSAPRIYFAMAKDGIFFKKLALLHPKYKTPHVAMIFQSVWAIILVLLWGSFIRVITFVTFMDILFIALGTASIFAIRKKYPNQNPAFKLKMYPLIPLVFMIISLVFVFNTAFALPVESFAGLGILFAGIPFFYYFKKKNNLL